MMESQKRSSSSDSDEAQETADQRRRRKNKDQLDQIKRKSLATKRNLCAKPAGFKQPKTRFMKTLHKFAPERKEIADASLCQNLLLNNTPVYKRKIPSSPLHMTGFFRGGIKGKPVSRAMERNIKLKAAILNNDALSLLQSGGHSNPELLEKLTTKNVDSEVNTKVAKTLPKSSNNNGVFSYVDNISPVLSKRKNHKKKLTYPVIKKVSEVVIPSQPNRFPVIIQTKNDECKQKLCKDELKKIKKFLYVNNEHVNRSLSAKSSPDVIYFNKYIDQRKQTNEDIKKHINPMNQQTILTYLKIGKSICDEVLGDENNAFFMEDPSKSPITALKTKYASTYKEYLSKQRNSKPNLNSTGGTINSSNSETMIEPDSAIRRMLKTNIELISKSKPFNSENYSDWSSNDVDDLESFTAIDFLDNSFPNKKSRFLTDKNRKKKIKVPLLTQTNINTESLNVLKNKHLDQNHSLLLHKYLNDITKNKSQSKEINDSVDNDTVRKNNRICNTKEFFQTDNDFSDTIFNHKTAKHVPRILRKNRSLGDCIVKEKMLLNMENSSKPCEAGTSEFDFGTVNTINFEPIQSHKNKIISNQTLGASKYSHNNFNKPLNINVPLEAVKQNKKSPKMCLFEPTKVTDNHFVVPQNFCISPINNIEENKYDYRQCRLSQDSENSNQSFCKFKLSQGSYAQDNNSMSKMASFGEIQERTDRLTLRSSQNQNCSQEYHSYHSNPHQQQFNSSESCRSQFDSSYTKIPTPRIFNIPIQPPSYTCCTDNYMNSEDVQYIPSRNTFKMVPPNNNSYPIKYTNTVGYPANDYQTCGNREICTSMQHKNSQQAMKFIAVGENSMPQRRPVYRTHENNYVHKVSSSNPQHAIMTEPLYSETVPRYVASVPSIQYYEQGTIVSPGYELNSCSINKSFSSNVERLMGFNNQESILERNNVASNNMSNQIIVHNHGKPMHSVNYGHNYVEQQVFLQKQLPQHSQFVSLQPQCCYPDGIEAHNVNSSYLQQIDHRALRAKRP